VVWQDAPDEQRLDWQVLLEPEPPALPSAEPRRVAQVVELMRDKPASERRSKPRHQVEQIPPERIKKTAREVGT
jgi:hypothetical protein